MLFRVSVCALVSAMLVLAGACGGGGGGSQDAQMEPHDGPKAGSDGSMPGGADAARSTVTISPTSVAANGTDTATITVTVKDSNGAPVSAAAVTLSVSGSGNTVSTPAATDASGVTTATLASTVAETKTVTATIGSVTVTQMPTVQFVAGAATKLGFGVQPSTAAAGSAIAPALTVEIEDANGNVVAGSSATVSVAIGTNPSGGVLAGTASQAASSGVAMFSNLSIDKPGAGYTLLASAAGLTSATSSSFTISPGAPTHLVFLSSPTSTTAGTTLASTQVAIEDALGNVVTTSTDSVTMTLGAHPNGATLAGTMTVAAANGIATFADLSISKAGTGYTLIASDGALMAATATFDIAHGPLSATMSTLAVNPGSLAAGGTSTLTVTAEDAFGNAISGQSVGISSTGTANTLSPASGTTNANGVFTATLSSTKAQQKTVTATLGAVQLQTTVTFTAGALSSTQSTLVANPGSLAAGTSSTLTVTALDSFGNPIAGQSVTLTATGTTNTLTPASGMTNASGVFTANLSSTKAEPKTVTATLGAVQLQTIVTFTPGPLSSTVSTLTASPGSVVAGSTSTLTVTAEDAFGNAISGQSVTLVATGTNNTLSPASGTTNTSGVFTATLSSTKAQAKTVTATLGAVQLQATVTFTPGALSATVSTLVANPTSVVAGASSTLTLTAKDSFGNPISGQGVSLAVTGTANTLTPASGTTNASGVVTATLSSTKAEQKTVTATMGAVQLQATVTFTAGALSVAHSQLWANPASLVADGKQKALITVILRDAFDNRISGQAVTVAVGGTNNTLTGASGTTNANGALFTTVSSTTAELKSITATIGASTLTGSITFITAPVACAGTTLFPSVPSVPIPNTTYSNAIRTGDFNGDGKPDFVTANSGPSSNTINVALGKGNGLFQTPIQTTALGLPTWLELADVNGDGKQDVAAVENTGSSVEIYLGSGTGSFTSGTRYPTGSHPNGIATGDFNGDGKIDIVTADNQGHTVSILLGNGSGVFGAPTAFSTGASSTPISVVAGDFNGDSKLDVAVSDDSHDTVVVLLGNGNGTLGVGFSYATGPNPAEVISRDFNGDGHADLAVAHHNNNPGGVSVLLGNGDGTFRQFVDYSTGAASTTTMPYSVVATDLNGDGHWDLVAANNFSGDVSVLLGNGDGTFQANVRYNAGPSPFGIAAADFDGDGHMDVATANSSPFVTALLGTGTGGFKTPSRNQAGGAYPGWEVLDVTTADFNADGILDLATTDNYGVTVFTGNGDGTFATQPWISPVRFAGRHVTSADVNLDGYIDIIATLQSDPDGTRVYVLLSNGDGTFEDPIALNGGTAPTWVVVADLNRDGKPDLAVTSSSDSSVYVLLGNGDGMFGTASTFVTGAGPLSVVAGDFTGDGKLDLVTANEGANPSGTPGSITLLVGTGTGSFGIGQTTALPAIAQVKMLSAGDVNADGKLDVVVGTSSFDVTRDGAQVFLGNGNGTFGSPAVYNGGGMSSSRIVLADLNNDGKLDVADLSVASRVLSVLTGNGLGNFAKLQSYPANANPFSGTVGDFDLDGRIDFVSGDESNGGVPGAASVQLQSACLP